MNSDRDEKVSHAMKKMTDNSEKLIPAIWKQIEDRIDFENQTLKKDNNDNPCRKSFWQKKTKKKYFSKVISRAAVIAAVLTIAICSNTIPGQAFFSKIYTFFDINKEQDFFNMISNETEKVDSILYESKLGYVLYYDDSYFTIESRENTDKFLPNEAPVGSCFEVELLQNTNGEKTAEALYDKLQEKYEKVDKRSEVFNWNYSNSIVMRAENNKIKENYWIVDIEGKGTYVINVICDKNDGSTLGRFDRMLTGFRVLDEKTMKSVEQGENILIVDDYNKDKYELVRIKGEEDVYLMDKAGNRWVYASWRHMPAKDMETAAKEECEKIYSTPIRTESDLDIASIKVVDEVKEGNSAEFYFIDDQQGGTYRLFINTMAFTDQHEKTAFLKSIKVLPREGNENRMKIKEIENIFGGYELKI